MSNTSPQHIDGNTGAIFAQLNPQDVEEFYTSYQYWNLQHQINILQTRLNDVRKQIIENTERIQEVQPTAIELAILARLQSNGVGDVNLLDRMLERGESWLDRTMQRLDYLEQLDDFISDDYTQWCQHALEGAYDWIDSVLDGSAIWQPTTATTPAMTEDVKQEELIEATEELFLQKISTDDELLMHEITMKRPSITIADLDEIVFPFEDAHAGDEGVAIPEKSIAILEESHPIDTPEDSQEMHADVEVPETLENSASVSGDANQGDATEDTKSSNNEDDTHIAATASEEPLSVDDSSTSMNEHPSRQETIESSPIAQKSSTFQANATQEHVSPKRLSFIQLFLGKIWGS